MMIEPACSLEDACRQVQAMINQISRNQRDSQSQNPSSLEITVGNLSKVVLNQKKDQPLNSRQSIQCKLTKLYFEELQKNPHANSDSVLKNLVNESDLLGKLVQRDGLHTLIVNLYAGNKGYSLAVRNSTQKGLQYDKLGIATGGVNSVSETQLMGYEQGELLTCIDNGQLPGVLAEQLEVNNSQLFYDGCIIAEVRDYRRVYPHNKPEAHHVLLKPSTQSILSDVSALTSDGDWSHEERLVLESQIVAATQGPLCLDPNPIAGLTNSRLRQCKALLTSQQLVRQARKFSQVTLNRKRKLEQLAQPEGITIQDLMQRLRTKRTSQPCSTSSSSSTGFSTACPPPSLVVPALSPPSSPIDVLRFAKAYEQPRETKDCLPQLIEEYILETERGQGRIYHIKLSILQRPSNSEYLGELYVDIDYREAEKKGSSCRFTLGTRGQANHYIQQFTEIFTEEGRKNVKIQHIVPGQAPRVTCTPSMQRIQQQQQQQQQQLQQLQQNTNAQRLVQQVKTQLVAQQLQHTQSQRVAQQILTARTQGHLNSLSGNQLNSLAGQVANSIKAITEAARQQQQQQQQQQPQQQVTQQAQPQLSTVTQQQQQQPVASLLNCLDNVSQNLTGVVQSADGVSLNVDPQQQAVNVARIPTVGSQNLDNTAKVTLPTADLAACNGSANILVFQQKAAPATVPSASSNVPVLQAQLQAGTLNSLNDTSNHNDAALQRNSTNLAISALANSLMNSAQQFTAQQAAANAAAQAAAAAAAAAAQAAASSTSASSSPTAVMNNPTPQVTPKSNNAAILSLLNSSPANLQQKNQQSRRISLNAGSLPQRVLSQGNLITVPSTTGQQQVRVSFSSALTANQLAKQQPVKATAVRLARVQDANSNLGLSMPGLSALLAGTPNEDNTVPGITAASSLFERLTASSQNQQSSQPNSPMTSPPPATPPLQQAQQQSPANVNLQGVNLAGLQSPINGLQNVQVSIPGLSQPITMSLNVSAATPGNNVVTPTGVIVSLPISSATNTCSTVSSMVPATIVTTAAAGNSTVVITNPANAHLSLPIAQLIPSAVKGLTQQSIRGNNAGVALTQGGQIQLVGSQRPRVGQMARQLQGAQGKALPNQLMAVSKTVTANQLVLSRNKQILTPIVVAASKPMLMANQASASSPPTAMSNIASKQTLLAKTLNARSAVSQCNAQPTTLNTVTGLSPQQIQQIQQHIAAHQQQKSGANAALANPIRAQIQPRGSGTNPLSDDLL